MPEDLKITALTALTAPASGDLLCIVDISDPTMAATGTDKKMTIASLFGNIPAQLVGIGDTANAKMTVGLTINQGANDNEILALKSSDVEHGMTSSAEADTFFLVMKALADTGGARLQGFSETIPGIQIRGSATNDDTAKTTAALAPIVLLAEKISGTSTGAVGADANLAAILNSGTARFIFDAEGSGHSDVEWTTYDDQDDIALLTALELEFDARKAITQEFGRVIRENKELLRRAGIVNFYDDGPRAMVNWTRLNMLMVGALRQLGAKAQRYEQALLSLGVEPKLLEA